MTGTPISVKEKTFETEARFLSPYAKKSCETKGRARAEAPCEFRTDFQRDRARIIYSNSFKRLKNKTQVFFAPEGDHYITRLTHTLDVAQISRSIARALSLNEDLAEAIALGHDLGHTPFGHVGERVLDKLSPTGFEHNIQSLRVVDVIEKEGRGLNLTEEVRDGILQHKSTGHPATLEGAAVSLADRIAHIITTSRTRSGRGFSKIRNCRKAPWQCWDTPRGSASIRRLRTFTRSLWNSPLCACRKKWRRRRKSFAVSCLKKVYALTNKSMQERAERMLTEMFEYFMKHTERLPAQYVRLSEISSKEQIICAICRA